MKELAGAEEELRHVSRQNKASHGYQSRSEKENFLYLKKNKIK